MRKKVLIVEAHSDDSAISVGGFLEKFKHEYEYHFALVSCSDVDFHHAGLVSRKTRLREYRNFVNHFDGIFHQTDTLPFDSESRLDTLPKELVVRSIEEVIQKVKPEILIFQGPSFHHDHTIVYESTIAATRPTSRHFPDIMLIMENPTYVHTLGPSTDFKANYYVELSDDELMRKNNNFSNFFPSQIREEGNYLSAEGIRAWARYRGVEARSLYAEALSLYSAVI